MTNQAETVRRAAAGSRMLPALLSVHEAPAARPQPGFTAQLAGATGQRRGLKGGAPVLQAARRAYLQAQWCGGADRRTEIGGRTLTCI